MANVGDRDYHLATVNIFNEDDGPMITVFGAPGLELKGTAQQNHEAVGRLIEQALPRYMAAWGLELTPLPMVLHCPKCGFQHIDEPDPADNWDNPPHTSHKCLNPGCGTIWRPADVPTAGVHSINTRGKKDNWHAGT